jgi:hypothetical protein
MIQIIALLYAGEHGIDGLREFESRVIPILREHKGVLISASSDLNREADAPDEIHVIQFPSLKEFEAYKIDLRVTELSSLKAEMIRKMHTYTTNSFHQYF